MNDLAIEAAPDAGAPALPDLLRRRATAKVLGDVEAPAPAASRRSLVERLLEDAAWAPFHYARPEADRGDLPSPVPWRAWALDAPDCRALLARLRREGISAGIVADMLAVAEAVVLLTWRPAGGRRAEDDPAGAFDGSLVNMEHVAAAGAMAQSLLLGATALGLRSYWSSGGVLRGRPVTGWIGVPEEELSLGAVFLFPAEGGREARPGKWRDARGSVSD
jgi:nitroreductase